MDNEAPKSLVERVITAVYIWIGGATMILVFFGTWHACWQSLGLFGLLIGWIPGSFLGLILGVAWPLWLGFAICASVLIHYMGDRAVILMGGVAVFTAIAMLVAHLRQRHKHGSRVRGSTQQR